MTRPLRMNRAGGWYHVMHRGIERRSIFGDERDREHFLELLAEARRRYGFVIHGYVEMTNHYHAIVETPEGNLSRGMQWVNVSYSAWYNARYRRVGPLFQGRFKSVPVEDGAWAYELSLYLHLNPLNIAALSLDKAGKKAEQKGWVTPTKEQAAARVKRLREYPWSSYRAYAGYGPEPEWMETGEILKRTGKEGLAAQVKAYRQAAKQRLTRGVEEGVLERLRDGVAIGSEAFRKQITEGAGGGHRETAGRRALRRRVGFADIVRAVEREKGERWERFARRRADWGRPMVMWLARRHAGMTLREIGEEFGGVDYAAVSAAIKRWDERLRADGALRPVSEKLDAMLNVET